MAVTRSYDDQYGNTLIASYWRVVQVNIGVADRSAMIIFYGYKDDASRKTNKQSVGSKSYSISGDNFDAMMAKHLAPDGPNLMEMAYKHAKATKDVVVDPQDATKNVSFFENAKDV